ncbi:hypothetical protein TNCV_5058621 [Trichonephila clavipes]|nr:hypothetical protein TNCV_5058621 [Trichonephila clavipes]
MTTSRCPSSKLGWKRAKSYCMVVKATANDRRHLALCHDEFRGPRSGLCRSGGISNSITVAIFLKITVFLLN